MTRVGIVGCGRVSDLHASAWSGVDGSGVAAVCDIDRAAAEAKAREWGAEDAAVFADYRELCRSRLVDLVEVLVPHHLHRPVAVCALEHGLHVSVQKPMATTLADADAMIETARRSPGVLKVFENFVCYPPVVRAKRLIERGVIGEPLSLRIKSNPGDPACGWDVPDAARAWRQEHGLSGGGPLTFDDGHHKLAAAWFLMGRIERVWAQIGSTRLDDGRVLDAPAVAALTFSGGRMGCWEIVHSPGMKVQTGHYAQDDHLEVTGSEGWLQVTRGHGYTARRAALIAYRDGITRCYDDMPSGWETSFAASVRDTAAASRGETETSLTGAQGRHLLEAGLAMRASAASGRPVAVS